VIELVSFKVTAVGRRPALDLSRAHVPVGSSSTVRDVYVRGRGFMEARVVHRSQLEPDEVVAGPAVVEEEGSTTFVEPGMSVQLGGHGALMIDTGLDP
jgi:N-methylhydantoinase A